MSNKTTTEPFWTKGLDTLQQLANEPVATVDELRALRRQLDMAIDMVELGMMVAMTEQERTTHTSRFGARVFIIGDYVIKKRSA